MLTFKSHYAYLILFLHPVKSFFMQLKYYTHLFSGLKALLTTVCLTVSSLSFAQPANDNCGGAISVTPGAIGSTCSPTNSTTATATTSSPIPSCATTATRDLWYSFTATGTTYRASLVSVTKTNATAFIYYYGIAAYSGACGSSTTIQCIEASSFSNTPQTQQITLNNLTPGQTYYIQVWAGEAINSGGTDVPNDINFGLCVTELAEPPVNDACSGALSLFGTGPVSGSNSAANDDVLPAVTCGTTSIYRNKGVWYTLTPTTSGSLTVSSCGSTFDTYLRVYSGSGCSSLTTCVASNNTSTACNQQAVATFNATANTVYYVLLTSTSATVGGAFTLAATGVPLKVDMGTLSGKITPGNYARLNWTTYNEDNNQRFEIQRSADGKLFEYAGFVQSKGDNGNSTETQTYDFTDPVAATGRVFYRLKQTNTDQSVAYSNVISLGSDNGSFSLTATPNPATNKLNFKIRGRGERTGQLLVTDLSGKVCRSTTIHNDNTEIDLSALASGIYLLKYADAQYTQTIKIQKQ